MTAVIIRHAQRLAWLVVINVIAFVLVFIEWAILMTVVGR